MPTSCRLIVDPPQSGSWNMAVDEWLLRSAADEGMLSLRFYEWREPTLSLGYFQSYADRTTHAASLECPVVRRASGGGALVHHHELTYSLAVPPSHSLARNTQALYDAVHQALIDVLTNMVPPQQATISACRQTERLGAAEPFLCFLRRTEGDVIFAHGARSNPLSRNGDFKICGSAQRKYRGAVLQHGGVLLAQSEHAPELPGIRDLAAAAITPERLRDVWVELLAAQLGLDLSAASGLERDERAQIDGIEQTKFAYRSWTSRR